MARHLNSAARTIFSGLQRARRALGITTAEEAEAAYLDGATDLIDLEMRMREADRHRRVRNGFSTGL